MPSIDYSATLKKLPVSMENDKFIMKLSGPELSALVCTLIDEAIHMSATNEHTSELIFDKNNNTITFTSSGRIFPVKFN